jgi:cell division protein FtsB
MKKVFPTLLLLFAAALTFKAIFANDSYGRLRELQVLLHRQREANQELKVNVLGLKRQISSLQQDPRTLEKAARNELVLARPGEMVFIFDDKR